MAVALAAKGWKVDILGARTPSTASRLERMEGVFIHRVRTLPFTRKNLLLRAGSLASVYPAFLLKALTLAKPDVIVSLTDPPLVSLLAQMLAGYWKIPHLHWPQDIYPEVAIELGVLQEDSISAKVMKKAAHSVFRKAQSVVPIGRCMESFLEKIGVPRERLHFIPNWTDPDLIHPDDEAGKKFRVLHDLENNFVIFYIGNLGMAHGLEWFLEAAKQLESASPRARFVFAGSGPRKKWLFEEASRRGLGNILALDAIPRNELSAAYSAADIHITSLDPRLEAFIVPSKIYAALAAQKPCVFIGPPQNEAARLVHDSKAGAVFSPEDVSGFLRFVAACENQAALAKSCGENARRAALDCTLENSSRLFDKELTRLISREKTPQ